MRYAVVIEKSGTGYAAWVFDLPGCVAVADTQSELRRLIREAVELHVQELVAQGAPLPEPSSAVDYVEVTPAA